MQSKNSDENQLPAGTILRSIYGFKREAEKHSQISMTIPNDSYSISDLFNRAQNGILPDNIRRQTAYDSDPSHTDHDLSKLKHADLSTLHTLSHFTRERTANNLQLLRDMEAKKNEASKAKQMASTDVSQKPPQP